MKRLYTKDLTEVIAVRLSKEDKAYLMDCCNKLGLSASELFRFIVAYSRRTFGGDSDGN